KTPSLDWVGAFDRLIVQRMALTGGASPVDYLKAFNITLFLTSEEKDVEEALKQGEEKGFLSLSSLCACV
ncbi:5 -nucleotidase, partial [Paramuricea clavata]